MAHIQQLRRQHQAPSQTPLARQQLPQSQPQPQRKQDPPKSTHPLRVTLSSRHHSRHRDPIPPKQQPPAAAGPQSQNPGRLHQALSWTTRSLQKPQHSPSAHGRLLLLHREQHHQHLHGHLEYQPKQTPSSLFTQPTTPATCPPSTSPPRSILSQAPGVGVGQSVGQTGLSANHIEIATLASGTAILVSLLFLIVFLGVQGNKDVYDRQIGVAATLRKRRFFYERWSVPQSITRHRRSSSASSSSSVVSSVSSWGSRRGSGSAAGTRADEGILVERRGDGLQSPLPPYPLVWPEDFPSSHSYTSYNGEDSYFGPYATEQDQEPYLPHPTLSIDTSFANSPESTIRRTLKPKPIHATPPYPTSAFDFDIYDSDSDCSSTTGPDSSSCAYSQVDAEEQDATTLEVEEEELIVLTPRGLNSSERNIPSCIASWEAIEEEKYEALLAQAHEEEEREKAEKEVVRNGGRGRGRSLRTVSNGSYSGRKMTL